MSTGYNWAIYDREFRRIREETLCAWDEIHLDLQLMATKHHSKPDNYSFTGYKARKYTSNTPSSKKARVCFAFNSPVQRCTRAPCPYKHICKYCSNSHPAYMCRERSGYPLPKPPLPTPVNPKKLESYLFDYPHKAYILSGFTIGFRLQFNGPICSSVSRNSPTTLLHPADAAGASTP